MTEGRAEGIEWGLLSVLKKITCIPSWSAGYGWHKEHPMPLDRRRSFDVGYYLMTVYMYSIQGLLSI